MIENIPYVEIFYGSVITGAIIGAIIGSYEGDIGGGIFSGVLVVTIFFILWEKGILVPLLAVVLTIWLTVFFIKRDKAERDAKRKKQKRIVVRKEAVIRKLATCIYDARNASNVLCNLARNAKTSVEKAEYEFREGAFAPFWDNIEEATKFLANFNNSVKVIKKNLALYRTTTKDNAQLIGNFRASTPAFDIDISSIPNVIPTEKRMSHVVRQAQKNIDFATIYQQRRTNKILISGFSSLLDAHNNIKDALIDGFGGLSTEIYNLSMQMSEHDENVAQQHRDAMGKLADINESIIVEGENTAEQHRETQGKLTDINESVTDINESIRENKV